MRLVYTHGLARRRGAQFIGAELNVEIDGLVGGLDLRRRNLL